MTNKVLKRIYDSLPKPMQRATIKSVVTAQGVGQNVPPTKPKENHQETINRITKEINEGLAEVARKRGKQLRK